MSISQSKVLKINSGQTVYRVWGLPASWASGLTGIVYHVFPVKPNGKKIGINNSHNLDGACGNRYFRKATQAQKFADEIKTGYWPWLSDYCLRYHAEMDEMDNFDMDDCK